ncbi:MAG: DUF4116 domain-containing protein, partial [Erysipelotrichaceae bacterium]
MTEEEALTLVSLNGILLENLTDFQNNRKVVLNAVDKNWRALEFASESLKNDIAIALRAIKISDEAWLLIGDDLKNNKEFASKVASIDGMSLGFMNDDFKNDEDIVIEAVLNCGDSLMSASSRLRDKEKIVRAAVNNDSRSLRYASERLQNDETFLDLLKYDEFIKKLQKIAKDTYEVEKWEDHNEMLFSDSLTDKWHCAVDEFIENNKGYESEVERNTLEEEAWYIITAECDNYID